MIAPCFRLLFQEPLDFLETLGRNNLAYSSGKGKPRLLRLLSSQSFTPLPARVARSPSQHPLLFERRRPFLVFSVMHSLSFLPERSPSLVFLIVLSDNQRRFLPRCYHRRALLTQQISCSGGSPPSPYAFFAASFFTFFTRAMEALAIPARVTNTTILSLLLT